MSRAGLAFAALALVASCSTEVSPSATSACKAEGASSCQACCEKNGTNASRHGKDGCTCVLRYWVFLQ